MPVTIYSIERGELVTVDKVEKPDAVWEQELPRDTYRVARRHGTEPPFNNAYWDQHAPGVYRCACCGTDLFDAATKFESGTGWPSFTIPVAAENVTEVRDTSLFTERTEVRCARCDAHLGHVFPDGPPPAGLRYCMNSASLAFVPEAEVRRVA